MGRFLDNLKYTKIEGYFRSGRQLYRIDESFSYEIWFKGSGWTIDVEEGFITDFASIPSCLTWIYRPHGDWGKAAVIHDKLYEMGVLSGLSQYRARLFADRIFYEAMKVLKVPFFRKRWPAYLCVRLFGWRNFGKKYQTSLPK